MLVKLIFKLLFKATIPIVAVVGVMSYGYYLKGGDPGAVFAKIVDKTVQNAKSSVKDAGDSVKIASPVSAPASKTTVYQWKDENGVTVFGQRAPEDVASTTLVINNNKNVVAAQKPVMPEPLAQELGAANLGPNGEPLPGVAGMNLPVSMDPATLSDLLQTMQREQ